MGNPSYFAVKYGRQSGICQSEIEFNSRILDFPGACGKKFSTKEAAVHYLGTSNEKELFHLEMESSRFLSKLKDTIVIYVDGSYLPSYQVYGGAFVAIKDERIVDEGYKPGISEHAANKLASLAGELNGTMLGVQYAAKMGYKKVWICYDNENIKLFGSNEKVPRVNLIKNYVDYLNSMREKHGIYIDFVKVKAHKGNTWNERADELAKKAAYEAKDKKIDIKRKISSQAKEKRKKKTVVPLKSKNRTLSSHEETFHFYQNGSSVVSIAERRGLQVSTILGHLARCYNEGMVFDIDYLCNKNIESSVLQLLKERVYNVSLIRKNIRQDSLYGEILIIAAKHGYKLG